MKKLNLAQKVVLAGLAQIKEKIGFSIQLEAGIYYAIMHPAIAWVVLIVELPFLTVLNVLISPITCLLNWFEAVCETDYSDFDEYFEKLEEA